MSHKVESNDDQIRELETRLQLLEQKLYLSIDSDEIINIQIEKNQILDEWKTLVYLNGIH